MGKAIHSAEATSSDRKALSNHMRKNRPPPLAVLRKRTLTRTTGKQKKMKTIFPSKKTKTRKL